MSSWCRRAFAPSILAALALVAGGAACAQQRYFVPKAELRTEGNTNRELRSDSNPVEPESSMIYKATLQALLGQATPRSDIELNPRLVFQEFPNCKCVDPVEEFLDLTSRYRTQKGSYGLDGHFSRQDSLNAEFGEAEFDDDSDPSTPPVLVDTGVVFVGQARTRYEIEPSFSYPMTQRTSVDGLARYESVNYESQPGSSRVGFDSPYAELVVSHAAGERTRFDIGPYYSKFEADSNLRETDSYGARIGLHHKWNELSLVDVVLRGERNKTMTFGTTPSEQSTTNWGIEIGGERKTPVGSLRYSIGRYLQPSGLGSRRQTNLLQLDYKRSLSERVIFRGAVRLTRDERLGTADTQGDRDRVRTELSLARQLTRTWEIMGGYRYAWQDLGGVSDQADNHALFLTVGFNGLDPRRPPPR